MLNLRSFGEQACPLDYRLQLPDITGPVVVHEEPHRLVADPLDGLPCALTMLCDEILDELRDVGASLAERRDHNGDNVQPIEQVLPQETVFDRLDRIPIGRSDNANVNVDLVFPPKPSERLALQDTRKFRLGWQLHLGDLIQEDGPAVRQLKTAGPPVYRPCKRAPLMTEDLALQQTLRDSRAVDRYKRTICAWALSMDGSGDQLLPGPALPDEEHGRVAVRDLSDLLEDLLHPEVTAHDPFDAEVLLYLLSQQPIFPAQLNALEGPFHREKQLFAFERLGQVVERALLERLLGRIERAVGGHQDDQSGRVVPDQPLHQAEAVYPRHSNIGQPQVKRPLLAALDGLPAP